MARPKGSKNKTKAKPTSDLNSKATHFATIFIAGEGSVDAEILAIRVLEKIGCVCVQWLCFVLHE